MTADPIDVASTPASFVLGRKLDSIPFSAYHLVIIVVLGFVGFIEGYDLALTGSLLVLAKKPLHMDPDAVRALATWPTFLVVIGGFAAAAMSDRISRLSVMQIGVILSTLCTLLILFVKSFEQLLILRLITGFFLGFTISAPFPIAAELMPARHRRTYAAIYETLLATAFTLLPFVGFILADHPRGFQLVGLPGGVTLFIAPVLVSFLLAESPRWLFGRGQLRWTATGILCGLCGGTVYYLIAILLPKALVSQGAAVALSFGLSSLVFAASIPGKLFNGYIMEVIGRRWTITLAFLASIPGLLLMVLAHRAGPAATIVFSAGALITGFTTLSIFPAVRMYLSEQFHI